MPAKSKVKQIVWADGRYGIFALTEAGAIFQYSEAGEWHELPPVPPSKHIKEENGTD